MDSKEYQKHLYRLREEQQKALNETDNNIKQWEKFRSDYVALKDRLKTLPDQLSYDVMVPFSKMGFMPGKLVHTNEILVLLGDNWFVDRSAKQAAQIVTRRLTSVDNQLEELYKQRKLLEPRRDFTEDLQNIAQGGGDVFDINEEYDEEKEKQWKDKHKKNVAEHRRKLKKEEKEQQKKKSNENKAITDEELWQRLDELERIELEEREMEMSDSEANVGSIDFQPSVPTSQIEAKTKKSTEELPSRNEASDHESDTSTSESLDSDDFYEEEEIEKSPRESEEREIRSTVIHFSHTKEKSPDGAIAASSCQSESTTILNPGDIYTKFKSNDGPTSILKKAKPSGQKDIRERRERQRVVEFETATDEEEENRLNPIQKAKLRQQQQKAFTGTIKEKAPIQSPAGTFTTPDVARPVSKFKVKSSQGTSAQVIQGSSIVSSVKTDNCETVKPVSRFKAQRQKVNET